MRTLTEKSLFKIGKHRDLTVDFMLKEGRNKRAELVSAYYKLTTINYIDSILDELKITEEWRIEKPGKDKQKGLKFLKKFYPKDKSEKNSVLEKMRYSGSNKSTKSQLQSKNHGK